MARSRWKKRADGRYAAQVYLGLDDYGKRKYKTVYAQTPKELEAIVADLKVKCGKGFDIAAAGDRFEVWANRWLTAQHSKELSAGHYASQKSQLKKWINYIGDIPIGDLHTCDLQPLLDEYRRRNPARGTPTSQGTLTKMKNVAIDVFEYAIQNRVLEFNPARYLIVPSAEKQERRALFDYEQRWITDTPHRAQLPTMVMMYSGLRRGELIPLRWGSVKLDSDRPSIAVERFVYFEKGKPFEKTKGKSYAARRVVYIPKVLADFLRNIKAEKNPTPFELVCPSLKGMMYTESAWKRMWDTYLRDLNIKYGVQSTANPRKSKYDPRGVPMMIPRFTAHWLRHTFATLLYLSKVDVETARKQLGHSNIQVTLDIYTHLDDLYIEQSMSKLDDYLLVKSS